MAAYIVRMMRTSVIDVMASEYVAMATLRGLPRRRVLLHHALPNALLPALNVIAINIAWLVGGVVVVEAVFNYPGIGTLMLDAVHNRDVPVLQFIAVIGALVYVVSNLLADLAATALNPRLRTPARASHERGRWRADSGGLPLGDTPKARLPAADVDPRRGGTVRAAGRIAGRGDRASCWCWCTSSSRFGGAAGSRPTHRSPPSPMQAITNPSGSHWLGTDQLGRDVLSRVIYGGRNAMVISLSSPPCSRSGSGRRWAALRPTSAAGSTRS